MDWFNVNFNVKLARYCFKQLVECELNKRLSLREIMNLWCLRIKSLSFRKSYIPRLLEQP